MVGDHRTPIHYTESHTAIEQLRFRNKWSIGNFSAQKDLCIPGQSLDGVEFGHGPHRFQLRLFPSGKDEACSSYISLFLLIKEAPTSRLSFRVNFGIESTEGIQDCPLSRHMVTINCGGIVTASKFFAIDTLLRDSRFLPDDVLTLNAEIIVYGEPILSKSDVSVSDSEDEEFAVGQLSLKQSLQSRLSAFLPDRKRRGLSRPEESPIIAGHDVLNGFAQLYEGGEMADFTIFCAGQRIKVHRAVLFAASGYFQGIFRCEQAFENQNAKVTLDDVDLIILKAILKFLYTGQCPEIETQPVEVAIAADRLLISSLKSRCEIVLIDSLTATTVIERMKIASQLGMKRLWGKTIKFMARNIDTVLDGDDWKNLRREDPQLACHAIEEAWTISK